MFLVNKKFLRPTRDARIVALLENLHVNPEISQNELGERASLSCAMVNNYLKELQVKKFIKAIPLDGKKYKYELTNKGEEMRRALLGAYMAEIVQVYSGLKSSIRDKLVSIKSQGVEEIVLFGASSTCEVVLSAINEEDELFRVIAMVDSDKEKQGRIFWGYVISPPEILLHLSCRDILISSFARHEEIKAQILEDLKLNNVRIFTL